jgi:ribosomal protein S27E
MNQEEKLRRSFKRVNCTKEDCNEQTIVFSHAKNEVFCQKEGCNELIAKPMGGKAEILGEFAGFISE